MSWYGCFKLTKEVLGCKTESCRTARRVGGGRKRESETSVQQDHKGGSIAELSQLVLRRKLLFLRCKPMGLGANEAIMRRQKGHMGGFLAASHRLMAHSLHSMWWHMPMQTS